MKSDQTVGPEFRTVLEDSARYPPPRVPPRPLLTIPGLRQRSEPVTSSFLSDRIHFLPSGRAAISTALQFLDIMPSDRVLVPSYHCGSLVEAVIASGAIVDFYRVAPDLTVDLEDLIRRCTSRTRCVIAIHYFGFPQPLRELASFCRSRAISLLEDCAHAFFDIGDTKIGAAGDFAIASARKFFPVGDGGVLIGRQLPNAVGRPPAGTIRELKCLAQELQVAANFDRLGFVGEIVSITFRLYHLFRLPSRVATEQTTTARKYRWFVPDEVTRSGTWVSQWVMHHTNLTRLTTRRRRNYIRLRDGLDGLRGGRSLFTSLPDGVVPYVFPLLLANPETSFASLKMAGVPLLRWEEVAYSDCLVSERYVGDLVQIPCHQDLDDEDIEWLTGAIRNILK